MLNSFANYWKVIIVELFRHNVENKNYLLKRSGELLKSFKGLLKYTISVENNRFKDDCENGVVSMKIVEFIIR